ncbi:related to alcohol dehydrogenase [Rhynchosporium agropyri]|uniref:Related to alcohol dehydrogenase n=1 Tax=Rhynchosporium agropyri TaxID=914238 RepID=A0A1E1JR69_9HELO|nr:related to alcohol dehydrogenase [Rhynchosporium agropyri]
MPKAIVMQHIEGKPGKVYYPLVIKDIPTPSPGPKDLTIQIHAAALNHRDFFLRQALYPSPSFDVPLLADGYGIVTAVGTSASKSWLGKKVILTPGRGWKDSPDGPESPSGYAILGGTKTFPLGTLSEVVVVSEDEVEPAPTHLSSAENAALPLTGLTGWRAFMTKSRNAEKGRNILITGIGGGVALNVLQFAVAVGCNVYVTSGGQEKIEKAKAMGAKGGVSYKEEGWDKELKKQLPKDRPYIDAIIDGAGGDVVAKGARLLKAGGVIVQYGMTVSPKMDWSMNAVLKNLELRGSTMGSRQEFRDMVAYVNEKNIKPVVSRSVKGIENLKDIDSLFEDIRDGKQFGKLVIELVTEEVGSLSMLNVSHPVIWELLMSTQITDDTHGYSYIDDLLSGAPITHVHEAYIDSRRTAESSSLRSSPSENTLLRLGTQFPTQASKPASSPKISINIPVTSTFSYKPQKFRDAIQY